MGNQTVTYGIATRLNKNQYQRNGYKFKDGMHTVNRIKMVYYRWLEKWKRDRRKRLSKVFVSK